ncbi:DUF5709 domain-containing protein [Motilibacter deserti]|uniref:DUF5709 domain-containing protein n=1 Tax=Motilibacter deserti TaxID=2714956 RepID=A0ABX0GS98_9ACTN|nr:hypothetical protein [Motilibacter deserti]
MTVPNPENPGLDPAFPDIVDDAAPERARYVDPQEPALPGDSYLGARAKGTTVEEQIEGESLDEKIAREVPDTLADPALDRPGVVDELSDDTDPEQPAGRLIEPDEGAHGDDEADMIATSALLGETDVSPEEQAMHIRQA